MDDVAPPEPPDRSPPPADQDTERLSDQLERWFGQGKDRTIGELIDSFGPRSFAVSFVVLMAFPALPLPTGGISHVLELATMLLAVELVVGRSKVWVPERWRHKQLAGLSGKLAGPWSGASAGSSASLALDWELCWTCGRHGASSASSLSAFPGRVHRAALLRSRHPPSLGVVVLSVGVLLHDTVLALAGLVIGALGVGLIIGLGHAVTQLI